MNAATENRMQKLTFEGKHVVVGITGGIAAYKAAELVSQLRQRGADVHCIMTEHATKLISPITFGELSGHDVTVDMFANISHWDVQHIALARLADLFIVAPATANIIGKMACGIADDMLSTTVMATKAPVLVVPAMNTNMYENGIVQRNIRTLREAGYTVMEPEEGHLACNTSGKGRFPKIDVILSVAEKILFGKHLLQGKKVIISAGGTQENIDPVRYIGNRSSGKMGYAIARAAAMEDAEVTLVSCTPIVAPATANIIGKMACGIADDMLSTTVMATKAPVLVVPAMNTNMYENGIVQRNIRTLREAGYTVMEPEEGHLACNTSGKGRFPKIDVILSVAEKILFGKHLLQGKKVIISAGGTQENIDPVRYIGNRSSGKMGYAIARAAAMEDAEVTLVSCTTELPVPEGVTVCYVKNARDLQREMDARFDDCDVAIMAAAVSDYRTKTEATQKIKKEACDSLTIELELNPDILYGLGQKKKGQFLVGFAAETNDVIEHGKEKLQRKNLDMLVANDVSQKGAGFNVETNIASILYKDHTMEQFPIMTKEELGHVIIQKIAERL